MIIISSVVESYKRTLNQRLDLGRCRVDPFGYLLLSELLEADNEQVREYLNVIEHQISQSKLSATLLHLRSILDNIDSTVVELRDLSDTIILMVARTHGEHKYVLTHISYIILDPILLGLL